MILDAGSSGTRIYIYRWLDNARARESANSLELAALPNLETKDKWTLKTHPGVSTFGDTPDLVGPEHLEHLYKHALDVIPKDKISETPIFLLATAGVRLLEERKRKELLAQICSYTKTHTKFLIPDCDLHVQVIPGETEGLYGWIAANYLVGGFDRPKEHAHGKEHHTYGFLDMGGASAQIAFAPNSTEAEKHANDLKLLRLRTVDGAVAEYKVFVTTWLGFGANEARHRYLEALLESFPESAIEVPDPCLPAGITMKTDGKSVIPAADETSADTRHLLGTGKFDECLLKTYPLLGKEKPCLDDPCLLDGVHVPAIDFDVNHFIGISEYWHSTHEIFEMGYKDTAYDFETYQYRVSDFCSHDWAQIEKDVNDHKFGKKVDAQRAHEICFKASWLINVLHDGIGIPRVGLEHSASDSNGTKAVIEAGKEKGFLDPFQAVNKIKHTEVSWALGKMVLYASSQVPPEEQSALPVGFGSNEPSIPTDFQYPGGANLPSIGEGWRDSLFDSDSPRRIPGFVMFLFILCIIAFFLCGRERRSKVIGRFLGPGGKKRGSLLGKVPFLSRQPAHAYERVVEDGLDLQDPNNFELGDFEDSSSDDDRGKSSLWNSPKSLRGRRLDSPSTVDLPGTGAISPRLLDRQGMALRTESSERLSAPHFGRKSRSGSPTRLKQSASFLSSLNEND